jgi:ubiquinone/menaquinone biosynthesis C-methylase UbiE
MTNIYESDIFSGLSDRSMHPGGVRLTDRAARLAGLTSGLRCADIGCGTGVTCAYLAGKYGLDITGLDISQALIDAGRRAQPGLDLRCVDCRTLPFESASLDAVLLECTLSVIGSGVLTECCRVLKPAGKLILSDITLKNPVADMTAAPFTAPQLQASLESSGFSVGIIEDHTPALRTYAAELVTNGGDTPEILQCLCSPGLRLRDLSYHLFIATKL